MESMTASELLTIKLLIGSNYKISHKFEPWELEAMEIDLQPEYIDLYNDGIIIRRYYLNGCLECYFELEGLECIIFDDIERLAFKALHAKILGRGK